MLRLVLPLVLPVVGTASAAATATAAAATATLAAASPVSSVAGPVTWGAIATGSEEAFAAAAASKAAATAGVAAGDSPVGTVSAPSSSKTAVPRRATKLASLAEERPALGLRHGGLRFPARIPHPKLGLVCLSSHFRQPASFWLDSRSLKTLPNLFSKR